MDQSPKYRKSQPAVAVRQKRSPSAVDAPESRGSARTLDLPNTPAKRLSVQRVFEQTDNRVSDELAKVH
ncbi:hypothetical protein [Allorhodopirellula solitaria]|uniref:hypothetical protein n=1 Tax=Allorhodopirellula solitaria TaxID=2527987 RepID=UPI0011B79DC5|nr:hypothetical protein [Allorhodopirellula solitaria]